MSFIKINCDFESHDTYFDIFVDTVWFPLIRLNTSGRLNLSSQYMYLIGQLHSVLNLWFDIWYVWWCVEKLGEYSLVECQILNWKHSFSIQWSSFKFLWRKLGKPNREKLSNTCLNKSPYCFPIPKVVLHSSVWKDYLESPYSVSSFFIFLYSIKNCIILK